MPLILTQHASRDLNSYLDREGLIYHFPSIYLGIVKREIEEHGDRRFLYQRPIRQAPPGQAGTYFAHGRFGDPYEDAFTRGHFFIDVLDWEPMRPVPLRDPLGRYYETGDAKTINLRGRSIRRIDFHRYHDILAAGRAYSAAPDTSPLQDAGVFAPAGAPLDDFRELLFVPPGTGYVPKVGATLDPYEAAALHERARGDHQATLELIRELVVKQGGTCFVNDHVDLYARLGERRLLIEVKSLTRQSVAVNRMRYGMGQLMDYRVRYKAQVAGAEPVLAFGAPPEREVGWIPEILQGNGIAFVARRDDAITPGNVLGEALPIFG